MVRVDVFVVFVIVTVVVAKLSQALALAGLSLALFPVFQATRPDPTGIVNVCTFRLPRKLHFSMYALFNQTRLIC